MHIYTHNAIHIYCLYIYIYILHTDANLACCYLWQQMHFNAPRKESGKLEILYFVFFNFSVFLNAFFSFHWIYKKKKKRKKFLLLCYGWVRWKRKNKKKQTRVFS